MLALLFALTVTVQDTAAARERSEVRAQQRAERAVRHAESVEAAALRRREAAALAMADAYAPGAADIVERARAARQRNERLVTFYSATVRQRIGVGIRALRRDRMLFGQELAANIEWHRDGPSRIEVTGARQRIPVAIRGDQVPDDLGDNLEWMVIDPAADYLRIVGDDDEGFIHPLLEHSEADYRFSAGDTTTITLPNGRTVRLLELVVRPRRSDFRLMNGSLWFDSDSYGMVRAVFAPARPYDLELDADSGDADDVPGFVKPIRGEVRYVTLEYGLYEQRWWMPRYIALDMEAQASIIKVPIRFERTYENYRVRGGTEPAPGARRPAGSIRSRERDTTDQMDSDSIARWIEECIQRTVDSATAAAADARAIRMEVRMGSRRFSRQCYQASRRNERWPIVVVIPEDTASLLRSPDLGPPILDMGDVISEDELRQLGREIGAIPQQPWQFRSRLPDGLWSVLQHARFNRVEGLSLGLSGALDFGRLRLDGLARLGVADLEPRGELGVTRPASNAVFRLGAYRRLAVANPETRALGVGNSLSAFFLQRDDGEYFRSLGAEITARNTNAGWWSARIYLEQQRAAVVETNASIPRLFDRVNTFRPNIGADTATQAGVQLTLRGSTVLSRSLMVGAELTGEGARGDYNFGKVALTLRTTVTPAGPLAFALEGAAGLSADRVPVQSRFFLGGPATIRGFPGGTAQGDHFWRGRVEVANSFPAFRVAAFGDVGWAGMKSGTIAQGTQRGTEMRSVGLGFSVLDGLIRLDLAHGYRPYANWRFDAYLDGIF